jgi:hypothetical protein
LAADALGAASDIMMAHPLALQLRNLQSLVELGVDKNTTVVFPAPLMSTIGELGTFLARETAASAAHTPPTDPPAAATEPPAITTPIPTAPSNGGGAMTGGRHDTD